ncbi:tetratricopeptide repeat protein [Puniceibacterium sp. HSS470]|nr:tetratricopeptide repeat protein [Puniceibacterium sp. HSS470]
MDSIKRCRTAEALSAYAAGRYSAAETVCVRTLMDYPNDPDLLHLLGVARLAHGSITAAIKALEAACVHAPVPSPEAHNNLGIALRKGQRPEDAIAAFRNALETRPGYAEAMYNLAVTSMDLADFATAADLLAEVTVASPEDARAHFALADALIALNDLDAAALSLRRYLRLAPGDEQGAELILASIGKAPVPARASPAFLRDLYRRKAKNWDLVPGYFAHRHVLDAVLRHASPLFLSALDAGCGTGLSGAGFRAMTQHMTGVDVSPDMLERARAKGIYDVLNEDDLLSFLTRHPDQFDLIVSAAALIHFGDLNAVLEAVWLALRPEGTFAFTTYSYDGSDPTAFGASSYRELAKSGCFAHGSAYLADLSKTCGFEICEVSEIIHEQSSTQKIPGFVAVLRKRNGVEGPFINGPLPGH